MLMKEVSDLRALADGQSSTIEQLRHEAVSAAETVTRLSVEVVVFERPATVLDLPTTQEVGAASSALPGTHVAPASHVAPSLSWEASGARVPPKQTSLTHVPPAKHVTLEDSHHVEKVKELRTELSESKEKLEQKKRKLDDLTNRLLLVEESKKRC